MESPDDETVARDLRMIADLTRERDAFESAHAGLADECVRLREELRREINAHCETIDRLEWQSNELLASLKSLTGWLGGRCVEGDTIGSLRRMLADAGRAIARAEGK